MANRFNVTALGWNADTVNITEGGINMQSILKGGSLPSDLLGLDYEAGGSSAFAGIAHRQQQVRQIDNLLNDSVSDQLTFKVTDKNGIVKTPFKLHGVMYRPDATGNVRVADEGKVETVRRIKKFQRDRVDSLMEIVMDGDDVAAYIFGISLETWKSYCKSNGFAPNTDMSAELKFLDCTVAHIESLPPSLTQTQSIAKLRANVQALEKNVNLQGLTNKSDMTKNMKDGHNTSKDVTPETQRELLQ